MPQSVQIGNRVELTKDADFSPYAIVRKGARGRVTLKDDSIVEIKLDEYHEGLRHHNNTIWTSPHVPDNVQFRRVRTIPRRFALVAAAIVGLIFGATLMEVVEAEAGHAVVPVFNELWGELGLDQVNTHHI